MSAWPYIENIATVLAIAAISLGIYYMGGGLWGLWSLLLMANLNQHKLR